MVLTGKAAVLVEPFKFELREYPVPPVEPGGILIKVSAAGLCGSDLHLWRGDIIVKDSSGQPVPFLTGHEIIGRVHSLGQDVSTDYLARPLKEGDRVVFSYYTPCHRCYHCIRGEYTDCPANFGGLKSVNEYPYCNGGFAEYYYLKPGTFVFKVEDGFSDEVLTPVNCAMATVMAALERSRMRTGDAVVIQGAGGLGLYAALYAREKGAGLIISIDGQSARLDLAKQCGADYTINVNEVKDSAERIERVKELCGPRNGADVVVEVAGFPQVVVEGLEMVRPGGTYVEVGNISSPSIVEVDFNRILHGIKYIVPTSFYEPWLLPVGIEILERTRDRYPITKIVSHSFALDDINEAFRESEWLGNEGTPVIRSVIRP